MTGQRRHVVLERRHRAAQSALQARDLQQTTFHHAKRGVRHVRSR
jgi:hypothetical protein